ncbi:hypothetical protein G7Y89_g1247 [Cudoniella acicularis]|uniref:2EXR domain-containing protein n=1 Tax=Cudoniella acicularis TaxID=354080 RepID=A0A8H4RVM6_9HELO|nr:hypothetical protein G7Y89_g1247 [Cudoniella acicularis]
MAPIRDNATPPAIRKQPARAARGKSQPIIGSSANISRVAKKKAAKKNSRKAVGVKKALVKELIEKTTTQKPTTAEQTSADEGVVFTETEERDDGPKFERFPDLPTEVRLIIWSFASPEPQLIVQRPSEKLPGRFTYRRKVPAVLHACRESRAEYLDTGREEDKDSAAARRRQHPIYRLYFQTRFRSSQLFFSNDIDMFKGAMYAGTKSTQRPPRWSRYSPINYHGMTELEISKTLKYLVFKRWDYIYCRLSPEFLRKGFPELETLTLLMENHRNILAPPHVPQYVTLMALKQIPAEKDGEMGVDNMPHHHKIFYEDFKRKFLIPFQQYQQENLDWAMPVIKVRFQEQLLETIRCEF